MMMGSFSELQQLLREAQDRYKARVACHAEKLEELRAATNSAQEDSDDEQ